MKRRRFLVAAIMTALVASTAGSAAGSDRGTGLQEAVRATAAFHDVADAQAAGYTVVVTDLSGATCIAQPGEGAMGIHYLNPTLLDGVVAASAPEALVYEPQHNGRLKLVALEYITFKAAWEAAGNTAPPSLFGQPFDLVASPNRYGLPDFYALHAWIWRPNPSGVFAMWNPRVTCDV
jgi:hypothetical protein